MNGICLNCHEPGILQAYVCMPCYMLYNTPQKKKFYDIKCTICEMKFLSIYPSFRHCVNCHIKFIRPRTLPYLPF